MGCCFSLKEPRIKISDQTAPGQKSNYLRPGRVINFTIDRKYNLPLIEIQLEGWFENSVRLWPKDNKEKIFYCWKGRLHRVVLHLLKAELILFLALSKNMAQNPLVALCHLRDRLPQPAFKSYKLDQIDLLCSAVENTSIC